jgi:hypothetical protein
MQSMQQTNKYNAANNLLCMNARIERATNSKNLGARTTKRYGLWKLLGAKRSFPELLGNSGIFGVVGGS